MEVAHKKMERRLKEKISYFSLQRKAAARRDSQYIIFFESDGKTIAKDKVDGLFYAEYVDVPSIIPTEKEAEKLAKNIVGHDNEKPIVISIEHFYSLRQQDNKKALEEWLNR